MKPTTQLLLRHLKAHGLTVEALAQQMQSTNTPKTLRKLRGVFDQESGSTAMIDLIRKRLGITEAEWAEAQQEEARLEHQAMLAAQRQHFKPHIWIETDRNWRPSPLFCLPYLLRIDVPSNWSELNDEDTLVKTVGAFVAALERSAAFRVPKSKIHHLLYRHAFESAYRFAPDGQFVGKIDGTDMTPAFWFQLR